MIRVVLVALGSLALGQGAPAPDTLRATAPAATFAGHTLQAHSGRKFIAFSGIRYAKPLVGIHRFQEAQMIEDLPPEETVDATKEGPDCMQIDSLLGLTEEITGEEDCLYLNVYTPTVTGNKAVMVWIHGGSWKSGSGSTRLYGPETLLSKDIVLVTINYRVGPLGFLSLEDEVFPGNLGLKDQLVALEWVARNIHAFGGDPSKVTLFGQSAGAASIHYHMMSPRSQDLFRSAISHSGTALSPWAFAVPGIMKNRTLELAANVNCTSADNDSSEILKCLQKTSAKEIVAAQLQFDLITQQIVPFRPVIEKATVKTAIVTQNPWEAPPSSKPWISGFTSSEAAFLAVALQSVPFLISFLGSVHFYSTIPKVLIYDGTASDSEAVTNSLQKFYLKGERLNLENLDSFVQMVSDGWFTYPTYEAAVRHKGPKYIYNFDHKGRNNIIKFLGSDRDFGVNHGDDIPYLFNNKMINVQGNGSDADREISKEMVELWTNFAINGSPGSTSKGVEWKEWTPEEPEVLHIHSTEISMMLEPLLNRFEFWRSINFRS